MSLPAGQLDRKVSFLRRVPLPTTPGSLRGAFAGYGEMVWAKFEEGRPGTGGPLPTMQVRTGALIVRDTSFIRTLTTSDRALVGQTVFEITSVPEADFSGDVRLGLSEAASPSLYKREFDQRGEAVTVRRTVPNAPAVQAVVRGIVTGYSPEELAAGINQGDRRVILSAADLAASGFPLPLRQGAADQVIVRGRAMTIQAIDDSTHRAAGVLHAYDLRVSG